MGKKLTLAPVYFTVAEVRFNPILSLENFVPLIQEQLRKCGYPDYQVAESISFKFNAQELSAPMAHQRLQKHVFMDMQKRAAFLLTANTLSFHTSKYEVFDTFAAALMKGVQVSHEAMSLTYTDRIGVRYLDAVMPRPEDTLAQYVAPEILGLGSKLDGTIDQSFSQTRMVLPKGHLLARCLIRSGRVGLPQDLQTVGLELDQRFAIFEGLHAMLDTDASHEERQPFSLADIQANVYSLHKYIGAAFRSAVTDYAIGAWE